MKYANAHGYSDVTPYEVVRAVSDKTIEVRRMKAQLDPTWKPQFDIGGFVAHCINNNDQKWVCESDEEADVVRVRLHKNGQWKSKSGTKFYLADQPKCFYDYNF